jgi:hypothetical protein
MPLPAAVAAARSATGERQVHYGRGRATTQAGSLQMMEGSHRVSRYLVVETDRWQSKRSGGS